MLLTGWLSDWLGVRDDRRDVHRLIAAVALSRWHASRSADRAWSRSRCLSRWASLTIHMPGRRDGDGLRRRTRWRCFLGIHRRSRLSRRQKHGGGVARISVAFDGSAFGALAVICSGAALAAATLLRTSRLTTPR